MKNILRNEYIFSIISKIISLVISLGHSIVIARYLGASIQGGISYISSVVSIGSIIITFGMHQSYPFYRKKYGKDNIYVDFISLIEGVFFVYLFVGIIFALTLPFSFEIKTAFVLIPFFGYANVMGYILLVENPNRENMLYLLISMIDLSVMILFMFMIERSDIIGVFSLLFAEILKGIFYTVSLGVKPRFKRIQIEMLKQLVKYGFFPMLALLMTTLNYKIDILMLKSYPMIISTAQIGIYYVGMSFADKVVLIPDTLKSVLVSKLSKGADEGEVAKVCRLSFWSSLLICAGLVIVGKPLINFLYGDEYNGAYDVLVICAWGSVFVGYFKLIAQYNIVQRKQIRNVMLLSLSIMINVALNLLLIPRYKLAGAAFASGVGYFMSGIIFVFWFLKSNHLRLCSMFVIQREDMLVLKSLIRRG